MAQRWGPHLPALKTSEGSSRSCGRSSCSRCAAPSTRPSNRASVCMHSCRGSCTKRSRSSGQRLGRSRSRRDTAGGISAPGVAAKLWKVQCRRSWGAWPALWVMPSTTRRRRPPSAVRRLGGLWRTRYGSTFRPSARQRAAACRVRTPGPWPGLRASCRSAICSAATLRAWLVRRHRAVQPQRRGHHWWSCRHTAVVRSTRGHGRGGRRRQPPHAAVQWRVAWLRRRMQASGCCSVARASQSCASCLPHHSPLRGCTVF
mmetsp:Transcript_129774/g.361561  ORF Transcript_129774/g.361561 Transcript_129774/m.361561 type:complete len:259 (-) Transcript_129774:375-1151(-)